MPVLIVRSERTIDDLRPRLVGPRGPREVPERLVAAIREANPDVDLDDLKPGTVLTIPEVEGARVRDTAAPAELLSEGIGAMVAAVGDVLASAGERAAQQAKVEASDRATVRRSLGLKAVAEATKRDQQLQADVDRALEALAVADEQAEEASRVREQAIGRWTEDLQAIRDLRT